MHSTITWEIIPLNQPAVIRNCPKCGNHAEYENSENFRVNANQNHIDVWLIYQCKKCKSTWNMEIHSRVHSRSIDKDLYQKYLKNDKELAKQYAFDVAAHSKNKSILSFDHILYHINANESTLPKTNEAINIELICNYPLDVRLDKIISKQLGISRELVKKMGKEGNIYSSGIKDIGKAKVKNNMILSINQA